MYTYAQTTLHLSDIIIGVKETKWNVPEFLSDEHFCFSVHDQRDTVVITSEVVHHRTVDEGSDGHVVSTSFLVCGNARLTSKLARILRLFTLRFSRLLAVT